MSTFTSTAVAVEVGMPDRMMAGVPSRLGLRLTHRLSGEPVTDIVESHERPLHLIVVSTDLEDFQHVHPWPSEGDRWSVDVTFPRLGRYLAFLEFRRASGDTVVVSEAIALGDDATAAMRPRQGEIETIVDGLRVHLTPPADVRSGHSAAFVVRVEEASSGQPVTALTPYLGAAAHVVVIDAGAASFGHAHGIPRAATSSPAAGRHGVAHDTSIVDHHAAGAPLPSRFGPEIEFSHVFEQAGAHRLWVQFAKPDRSVVTAVFDLVVDV